jgi:WxcM-like, C-terminal
MDARIDDLPVNPPLVGDVRQLHTIGPWPSKSGGSLRVPIMLSHAETMRFLDYDKAELARIGVDIRGVRVFFVHGTPGGGMLGNQVHRIRTEIAFLVEGSVRWEFEDLHGGTRELHATPACAVRMPPFVLHRGIFEGEGGTVAILANTLYDRDDPRTHDTYSAREFQAMRDRLRERASAG